MLELRSDQNTTPTSFETFVSEEFVSRYNKANSNENSELFSARSIVKNGWRQLKMFSYKNRELSNSFWWSSQHEAITSTEEVKAVNNSVATTEFDVKNTVANQRI